MKDAFFFDLDDTLYDEAKYVCSGFEEVARYLSQIITNSPSPSEVCEMLIALWKKNGRGKVFDDILEHFGLAKDDLVSTLIYIYRTHRPTDLRISDELLEIINHLERNAVTLGIITDGAYVTQNQKLSQLTPRIKWDLELCTDVLGGNNWKPAKTPFLVAKNLLFQRNKNWFYMGDNETKDFEGASLAGFTTIWWNPHKRSLSPGLFRPDYDFSSYGELSDFIEKNIT